MTVDKLLEKIHELCEKRDNCYACPLDEIPSNAICISESIADAYKVIKELERREDEKDY